MPTPLEYSYKVVKPFAYENSTSPVHQKASVNGTRFSGSGTLGGAGLGAVLGGPVGAGIGAAVGLGTDIWQVLAARKNAKKANEEARQAAAEQAARNSAEARAARAYNSEQAQIRRMRMAGLSPGLAYGQMSPSTAQAATSDKADVNKADTPKFDNESILHALQLLINQQNANTQAAAQSSTADLQSTQATLNRIEAQFAAQQKMAEISSLLANKELTDEQKISEIAKRMPQIQLLESQANAQDAAARNANATANVTETSGVDLANSQIASNFGSARNLNANASVTEEFGKQLAATQIAFDKSRTSLTDAQANQVKLDYNLKNDQYSAICNWLDENGYNESYAPLLMNCLESMSRSMGVEVTSLVDELAHLPANLIKGMIGNAQNMMLQFMRR